MNDRDQVLSTINDMTSAFHAGDVDGILRTYEPSAVVVGEPGRPVTGEEPLRALFADFIAARARFTFAAHEVIVSGDVALHLTPWKMTGVLPDGASVTSSGLSAAVLRRQADSTWLMVIDDPFAEVFSPAGSQRALGDGGP